jgi:hypothetical protein
VSSGGSERTSARTSSPAGNQAFVDAFYADVFRQWTPDELIAVALERSLACQPGACFN